MPCALAGARAGPLDRIADLLCAVRASPRFLGELEVGGRNAAQVG
jgi:hypothetical protein